ncbi:MAG: ferric reductase-like transmembrane domain-containing protein [Candidatus Micrarchaeota archaeon]|nr:ferric reductase-like transmembrane domain-containing protein [Candidatus Micrarchaeota archaeon]
MSIIAANYAFTADGAGRAVIRFMADSAFFLFSVSLILGPLAVIDSKYASLIEPRRAVGLAAFFFAAFHIVLVSGIYFSWQPLAALAYLPNIVAVPAAFVLLLAALTASDFAVQKMGMKTWKMVQRLVYIGFVSVLAHVLLVTNSASSLGPLQFALLALAVVAIAMQFYGFYLMRKRKGAAAAPA